MLTKDWELILNNQYEKKIILCRIPANSLSVEQNNHNRLYTRKDKTDIIDLNLNCESLIDRRSGIDFSQFLVSCFEY